MTGQRYNDTDENEIRITHGYSKDHRPDLMQIVSELVVSTDSGVPLTLYNHNGNANDNKVFLERSKALAKELSKSEGKLIADSKLYTKENATNLAQFLFVTHIPETNKEAAEILQRSVEGKDSWKTLPNGHFFQTHNINHYSIDQQWVVFYSNEGLARAEKSVLGKIEKEYKEIEKQLYHLQAEVFACREDAMKAINKAVKSWKYHVAAESFLDVKDQHNNVGRPKKNADPDGKAYKVLIAVALLLEQKNNLVKQKACFIIGTNDKSLDAQTLLAEYKSQNNVELGFRFLKSPSFFTSSFFLKSVQRINALIGIMSLALLVYSIAQRRLRAAVKTAEQDFVDPVYGKKTKPTMKRIMQMMLNVNEVTTFLDDINKTRITGITILRLQIIKMISPAALKIYSVNSE